MIKETQERIRLDEKHHVEEPFLEELDKLGWDILRLGSDELCKPQLPKDSYRETFGEVVLLLVKLLRKSSTVFDRNFPPVIKI